MLLIFSWYFGQISRQEATDLLLAEKEGGVFLVRDSASCVGDFVLCVRYVPSLLLKNETYIVIYCNCREDCKVSHYIINKMQQKDQVRYRIGDQCFTDLPSLVAFYKLHYLDTTPLIRPAPKRIERVIAKYDFDGQVSGDVLSLL